MWQRLKRIARTETARRSARRTLLQITPLETRIVPTATPYVVPTLPDVSTTAIITVGDSIGAYKIVGIPDGLGAFDNGDGTFTLVMNHEIMPPAGVVRAHGANGAFVSEWVINKSDLTVLSGRDFIGDTTSIFLSNNNQATGTVHTGYFPGSATILTRLCSADMADPDAFLWVDPSTGTVYGTDARIFMSGEESSGTLTAPAGAPEPTINVGRQFAWIVTDDTSIAGNQANTGFEIPHCGLFAWENFVANPLAQRKTVVIGTDDTSPAGQLYVWVGDKQTTGNVVERAGLTRQSANDNLYVVKVTGLGTEPSGATVETAATPASGAFTLELEGDVSGLTGGALETLSNSKGGTKFLRPEDGAWDPNNPSDFYFVVTHQFDQVKDGVGTTVGRSRLYRLRFSDIAHPELGGTIEALLDGTEDGNMFDNITVDKQGRVLLQEDVGGQAHNGKVWLYDIATDRLVQVARHDPTRFGDIGRAATAPFNNDEESSGIIDVSDILGPGSYLLDVQAHYSIPGELVEGGQLLKMVVSTPDWAAADTTNTVYVTPVSGNVLSNDDASPATVISHTTPANGTLSVNSDGSFTYTPNVGFVGQDSFDYTAAAVEVYKTDLAPLGTFGGVNVGAGAFGSAVTAVPGTTDEVYGLTDRGPNVDGPGGSKIEPIPSFTPSIGRFKLVNGQAVLQEIIALKAQDGTPYNGQVSTVGSTGETITELDGNVLPTSPYGFDPEEIVALSDGTFWLSDEYGPFIRHFAHDGTEIEADRLAPGSGLPNELALRRVNRGMEGLTVTPDESTLVGIMQSPLMNGITSNADNNRTTTLRIVTINLTTHETHEYLYLLDNPATTGSSVSEIMALSNTTFLVDERDGNYAPAGYKKLFAIDLAGATDVGPNSPLINGTTVTYDPAKGLVFSTPAPNTPIELLVRNQNTGTAANTLSAKGVIAVGKTLYLDVSKMLKEIDSTGALFSHDKLEGVTMLPGGKLVISNDSDFGIDGITNSSPPFQLHAKTSPVTGEQDNGEYLVIDMDRFASTLSSSTVTINVDKVSSALSVPTTFGVFGGITTLTATIIDSATNDPLAGKLITFTLGSTVVGSATTDANGVATLTNVDISGYAAGSHASEIKASFAGDGITHPSNGTGTLVVTNVVLGPDPSNPSLTALFVGGTPGEDHIQVESKNGGLRVKFTGPSMHFEQDVPNPVSRIFVYGGPGDDHIEVDNKVTVPAFLFGGADDDHLQGGGGPTVAVGGTGTDHIEGGKTNSILIGGKGADHVESKGGDGLLIGGYTSFDANAVALISVLNEWTRTDESYAQRVANLQNAPVGATNPNGSYAAAYFLNTSTVKNDGAGNHLIGGSGMDWFFANLDGVGNNGVKDTISGLKVGEVITKIVL